MTSLVEAPAQALANMSTTTYLATLSASCRLGRRRPARQMRARQRVAVGHVARLDIPHRRIVIAVQQRLVIAIGDGVPAAQLLLAPSASA